MNHTMTALSQNIDERLKKTLQDLEQAENLLEASNSDTTHIKQARQTIEEVRRQIQDLYRNLTDTLDKTQQTARESLESIQALERELLQKHG